MALNLTPHEITVYDSKGENVIARIPSAGELRLASREGPAPPMSSVRVSGVDVLVVPRQVFTGLNEHSPGFKHVKPGATIIVSMATGDYMTQMREYDTVTVLGSASGPGMAVRENGKILGTKALEYYPPASEGV